jgi:hypothetical protein
MNILKQVVGTVVLLGAGVLIGKVALPQPEPAPEQVVATGMQFEMPCPEHGKHVVTVTGTQVVRLYDLSRDDGATGTFPQEDLLGLMEELGVKTK